MHVAEVPSAELIDTLVASCSNWGRWGPSDERGTLNLLSPQGRLRGLRAAEDGTTVSLSRPLDARPSVDQPAMMLHHMLRCGLDGDQHGFASASDWIGLSFHGFGVTHLDALAHVFWRGQMYNRRGAGEVTSAGRCRANSVDRLSDGIVTRGVLLDAPRALGVEWVEPGAGLTCADLEECERHARLTVEPGDAVLVRTGRDARAAAVGPHDPIADGNPGLLPECAAWLRERDVILLGGDGASDVMVPGGAPHLMPIHVAALVAMGLPLLDNALLDPLAEACAQIGRSTFALIVSPLHLQRATGSPVNPLAVL